MRSMGVFLSVVQAVPIGVQAGIVEQRIQSVRNFPSIRNAVVVAVINGSVIEVRGG